MTKYLRFPIAALAIAALAPQAHAAEATASAGGQIIAALELTKSDDLYFGSIVPNARQRGEVEVEADGSLVCDPSLTCLGDDVSAAGFTVAGEPNYSYALTLPNTITLTSGTNSMTINDIAAANDATGGTIDANGRDSFTVGGILRVGAGQATGEYTGTMVVVVEYN